MFNPVAVIPHYNHSATLGAVLAELHRIGLPVLVIDDGSTELHRQVLQTFAQEGVKIYYRTPNQGKGGAMKAGLLLAAEQGFTHALQVDADGQQPGRLSRNAGEISRKSGRVNLWPSDLR